MVEMAEYICSLKGDILPQRCVENQLLSENILLFITGDIAF